MSGNNRGEGRGQHAPAPLCHTLTDLYSMLYVPGSVQRGSSTNESANGSTCVSHGPNQKDSTCQGTTHSCVHTHTRAPQPCLRDTNGPPNQTLLHDPKYTYSSMQSSPLGHTLLYIAVCGNDFTSSPLAEAINLSLSSLYHSHTPPIDCHYRGVRIDIGRNNA